MKRSEEEIQELLKRAKRLGIVDVDVANFESVKLACDLMEKHGGEIYKNLEERRAQSG